MRIKQDGPFKNGYNSITEVDGKHSDMLMDFGILTMDKGQEEINSDKKERAYVLIQGEVKFEWEDKSDIAKRKDFLDNDVWCLSVPAGVKVKITALSNKTELSVHETYNEIIFPSRLIGPKECVIEVRGKGTMAEAGTRIVRTIMDKSTAPDSNLMLGEDVHYPGKWSGFPSHSHNQPEIYFYKFAIQSGFGLLRLGDEAVLLENNDTVKIYPNLMHPQVTAPGYAMYYIWVIRHLENNPYIKPVFVPEHLWAGEPDAKIWPNK
ncbi:MAG: 5-deoxy-glucuronate isomerase [Clostridium sp.]|jgi:5-deoxy-glucuronate isomerase